MTNPFVVGAVASGDSFIGRGDCLKRCADVMRHGKKNSVSICGLPRIGKTSLVRNLLDRHEYKSEQVMPVYISLGDTTSFFHLWSVAIKMIFKCLDSLGRAQELNQYRETVENVCKANDYEALREYLIDFFVELSSSLNLKCVIAIDEFDQVSRVFGDNRNTSATYFQFIRELAIQPQYQVSFIIISRRRLSHLEERVAGGSVLHLSVMSIPLSGFNDDDLREYQGVLGKYGIVLSDDLLGNIYYVGGRSPYLLAQIGYILCDERYDHETDFGELYNKISLGITSYYEELLKILKDEKYYEKLIQLLVGPKFDLTNADVSILQSLGYVEAQYDDYQSICPDFTIYLKGLTILDENIRIWENLSNAEIRLRAIIDIALSKKYGTKRWENAIQSEYEARVVLDPGKYKFFVDFEKARKFIESMRQKYPGRGNPHLLKTLSFQELRNILEFYWDDGIREHFSRGGAFSEWDVKLKLLQKARDPLAHANPEFLDSTEIRQANIYCDEILQKTACEP